MTLTTIISYQLIACLVYVTSSHAKQAANITQSSLSIQIVTCRLAIWPAY